MIEKKIIFQFKNEYVLDVQNFYQKGVLLYTKIKEVCKYSKCIKKIHKKINNEQNKFRIYLHLLVCT